MHLKQGPVDYIDAIDELLLLVEPLEYDLLLLCFLSVFLLLIQVCPFQAVALDRLQNLADSLAQLQLKALIECAFESALLGELESVHQLAVLFE